MKTRMLPASLIAALALAACGQEASKPASPAPATAAKKEEARPMPPSAPTAAPAEGEKKPSGDGPSKEPKK